MSTGPKRLWCGAWWSWRKDGRVGGGGGSSSSRPTLTSNSTRTTVEGDDLSSSSATTNWPFPPYKEEATRKRRNPCGSMVCGGFVWWRERDGECVLVASYRSGPRFLTCGCRSRQQKGLRDAPSGRRPLPRTTRGTSAPNACDAGAALGVVGVAKSPK